MQMTLCNQKKLCFYFLKPNKEKLGCMMRIGYACRVLGPENMTIKGCLLKNATEERLIPLIEHNLAILEASLEYNRANEIHMFRISSDVIPFGSSNATAFSWKERFHQQLSSIGHKAKAYDIRLSMHPGQYTVLNSPDPLVVNRAIEDLQYHAVFLDSLGMDSEHKIVLHVGGVYGDKKAALHRFAKQYGELNPAIKARLVIENDDKSYHIGDVLELAALLGIPVVYDTLHNKTHCFDPSKDDFHWITQCEGTWKQGDGRQKIHYSQQAKGKRAGSHSETIEISEFMDFYSQLGANQPDIMLEVKDKNLSAVKCINCTATHKTIKVLEKEWSRYKYSVLERSPKDYQAIRALLKDKRAYPAVTFYRHIEDAFSKEDDLGHRMNGALHVWGYFKNLVSRKEKEHFFGLLHSWQSGAVSFLPVKRYLYQLAIKYRQSYLLRSYYFIS
jgi:UV DNA damage endonuclease